MAARNKPSPFNVDSQRFTTLLRTVSVEPTRKDRRSTARACFNTFESQWHRFLCKTSDSTSLH